VSTHLHRIFPKLGVTARSELKTVLHTRPLAAMTHTGADPGSNSGRA
jgi:hypothetical protein